MVKTAFLRTSASGIPLLLATINTPLTQRADAASSAMAVDAGLCQREVEACYDSGETCQICLGVDDTVKTELAVMCAGDLGSADSSSSTVTCGSVKSLFCCLDVMAPESYCLDDGEFVDYAHCFLEAWGCSSGEIMCEASGTQEKRTTAPVPRIA